MANHSSVCAIPYLAPTPDDMEKIVEDWIAGQTSDEFGKIHYTCTHHHTRIIRLSLGVRLDHYHHWRKKPYATVSGYYFQRHAYNKRGKYERRWVWGSGRKNGTIQHREFIHKDRDTVIRYAKRKHGPHAIILPEEMDAMFLYLMKQGRPRVDKFYDLLGRSKREAAAYLRQCCKDAMPLREVILNVIEENSGVPGTIPTKASGLERRCGSNSQHEMAERMCRF